MEIQRPLTLPKMKNIIFSLLFNFQTNREAIEHRNEIQNLIIEISTDRGPINQL